MTYAASQNGKSQSHYQGRTKIERYGWTSAVGPGTLMWVNKTDIKIDHSYQREANESKIIEIAQNFSWLAFCAIPVVRRPDGLYAVDGQHRVLATLRRADVTEVPCVVFDSDGIKSEARGFLDANSKRKAVSAVDKFRAKMLTGDAASVLVAELIKSSGRDVSKTGGPAGVRCVRTMEKCAEQDKEALSRIWPIIVALCQGDNIHERIVDSLFYVETHMPDDETLTNKRWLTKLTKLGASGLMSAIQSSIAYHNKSGAKVCAAGVVKALNFNVKEQAQLRLVD